VIRTMLAGLVLAAGLLLAGLGQGTAAGISAPALAPAATGSAVQKVVWVCGPAQCVWDPTPDAGYVMPGYAAAWGAPVYPGCFWKRGFLGRWKMICP
jgi:hypothetical protein